MRCAWPHRTQKQSKTWRGVVQKRRFRGDHGEAGAIPCDRGDTPQQCPHHSAGCRRSVTTLVPEAGWRAQWPRRDLTCAQLLTGGDANGTVHGRRRTPSRHENGCGALRGAGADRRGMRLVEGGGARGWIVDHDRHAAEVDGARSRRDCDIDQGRRRARRLHTDPAVHGPHPEQGRTTADLPDLHRRREQARRHQRSQDRSRLQVLQHRSAARRCSPTAPHGRRTTTCSAWSARSSTSAATRRRASPSSSSGCCSRSTSPSRSSTVRRQASSSRPATYPNAPARSSCSCSRSSTSSRARRSRSSATARCRPS